MRSLYLFVLSVCIDWRVCVILYELACVSVGNNGVIILYLKESHANLVLLCYFSCIIF